MTATRQADALQQFRRLHQDGILLLANAWDAGSARLIESLGAKAIATTSAGVAWAHGYPDGDALPFDLLVATTADITRILTVPLTVDSEGGYSDDPAAVGESIARLIGAGAAGINLEDGVGSPDLLCAKIAAIKGAAARSGQDVFINARTDVYLRGLAPEGGKVAEVLARAGRYRDAGADGIFVPGVTKPDEIRAIAADAPLPLNVMARPGLPGAAELAGLGVRRLSAGSGISQTVYAQIAGLARSFLVDGVSDPLVSGAMPYPEINALMAR
ncbi:isocitrate lyase/PEP mutase family protein [Inquilinus limosus]|uniref:PEP phosphonomutase n=1 Tax=Inquilinus limosus TaxID=171674 RepID=A0A211ZTF3_9PROT|nr:isocitrate lyase/phosphoenolpyruvate mutase family protein [Inquilinus limosus]OWJ68561.1 PEP phosphonomutase [Inquilinus limosus]